MTKLGSSAVACGALLLGFTLGMNARGLQSADDAPVPLHSVTHVSVFVKSVEKTAEWHRILLGTEIPKFVVPATARAYPKELNWNPTSLPRYGTIPLKNTRIELQEAAGGSPSRWTEFQEKHGQGIEHLGFAVPNVQEALARFQKAGGKLLMGGCPGCTAHVDMRETLGYIVELQSIPKE